MIIFKMKETKGNTNLCLTSSLTWTRGCVPDDTGHNYNGHNYNGHNYNGHNYNTTEITKAK